jgi:spermidine/putrescine transport system substrate-binding protein
MTRRQFMLRAAAAGLSAGAAAALLAACGGGASSSSASPSALDTTKPASLHLYNWQNEIAPENKTKFEQETGVKIVETYYDDNEMLIAKLKGGAKGYDLIVPSGYAVSILAKSGLLEPLDMSLIPGFTNLNAKFQKPAYDPGSDGKKYSVPWLWGTAGIAMRTDKLGLQAADMTGPSWQVLWDEGHKGEIDMLNDERETIGAALKLLDFSLNSTDQGELDQATQKLIAQKPLVRAYDSLNMKRNIVAGVPLVHTWNGDASLAADALGADKVFYGLPTEGYTIWVDNLAIPVGAPSPYWAHMFIDFMCQPQNAADLVNYVQYLSPNEAATPYVDAAIIANTPKGEVLARGEFQDDLGAFETQWGQAWQQVKSA